MDKIKLALIDLDGTLLRRKSSEHSFVRFLVFKRKIDLPRLGNFLTTSFKDALKSGLRQAIGMNADYLKGETPETVASWAREYGSVFLKDAIPKFLREKIRSFKNEGCHIVLLSGSLQILVAEVKDQLGAEIVIGRELEIVGGRYTGRRMGLYPYGKKKVEALFQKINPEDVDWQESVALADRMSDLPVFELVGRPIAVHPESALRRLAGKRGWEIIG